METVHKTVNLMKISNFKSE